MDKLQISSKHLSCKKCEGTGAYWTIEDDVGRMQYHICEDCLGEKVIRKDEVHSYDQRRLSIWDYQEK